MIKPIRKGQRTIRALAVPLFLLIIWEILSRNGFIRPSILPAPSVITETFFHMLATAELLRHVGISILRVIEGFALGAILAILAGILMGLYRWVDEVFSLIVGFLRPIPVLAWTPLLILWLGIDEASKITLIAIGTFWTVLINVVAGIKNVDKRLLEVSNIFEKDKKTLLLKVILPSSLPSIFTGLRSGIDMAWRSVVGAELIAASAGVGFLIMYARDVSQPDVMIVGMISIGLIGILIEYVLAQIEKRVLKWDVYLTKK